MITLIKDWVRFRKIKIYKSLEEKYRALYYGAVYSIDMNNRRFLANGKEINCSYDEHIKYVKTYRTLYLKYSNKTLNDLILDSKYINFNSEQC